MVFCNNCGAKNDEAAIYCVKCGIRIEVFQKYSWDKRIERWGEEFGKRAEEWGEDFGRRAEVWGEGFEQRAEKEMSNLGLIFGFLIGVIMVFFGLVWLAGIELIEYFWALAIIVFGLLILTGSIYGFKRKS